MVHIESTAIVHKKSSAMVHKESTTKLNLNLIDNQSRADLV